MATDDALIVVSHYISEFFTAKRAQLRFAESSSVQSLLMRTLLRHCLQQQ